ncbi:hypothetical protein ACJMK2_033223, partial [Sinanodonta woodiana]
MAEVLGGSSSCILMCKSFLVIHVMLHLIIDQFLDVLASGKLNIVVPGNTYEFTRFQVTQTNSHDS